MRWSFRQISSWRIALGLHLTVLSDPRNDIESQTVNGLLQKTIFSSAPQLFGQMLQTWAKGHVGARTRRSLQPTEWPTISRTDFWRAMRKTILTRIPAARCELHRS